MKTDKIVRSSATGDAGGGVLSDTHRATLSKELGGKPLPDLGKLDAAEIDALTEALRRARRNQQKQLQQR